MPGTRRREYLAPGVPGQPALVVPFPLAGEAFGRVLVGGSRENVGQLRSGTALQVDQCIHPQDRAVSSREVVIGRAETHHPGERGMQPMPAAGQRDQEGMPHPGAGGQRMPIAPNALVGRHQVDERHNVATSALGRDRRSNVKLGVTRASSSAGHLNRLGGISAQGSKAAHLRFKECVPQRGELGVYGRQPERAGVGHRV
jgi:hypothetical protein